MNVLRQDFGFIVVTDGFAASFLNRSFFLLFTSIIMID